MLRESDAVLIIGFVENMKIGCLDGMENMKIYVGRGSPGGGGLLVGR